ncbi:MAG TPA: hypothetical protein VMD08_17755 [Candidatus Baltobacteraceae bacterium]|nr:hypothetical protein [Candidatus Baltobacteraceae bacterium]
MPTKDAAFDAWAANFSSLIAAGPASFGLAAADATAITAAYNAWEAAYGPVTSPSSKTKAAVQAKNTARVTAEQTFRPYAQQISLNPAVSSDNKIALGLNPRTSTPSPISPPASNPVLTVASAGNLSLVVRYRDSVSSVSVKAKPYGVAHCQISYGVSATAVADPTSLPQTALATKSPLTLTFDSAAGGKQVYLAARWVTRTGKYSPWSPIVNFTVPASL